MTGLVVERTVIITDQSKVVRNLATGAHSQVPVVRPLNKCCMAPGVQVCTAMAVGGPSNLDMLWLVQFDARWHFFNTRAENPLGKPDDKKCPPQPACSTL